MAFFQPTKRKKKSARPDPIGVASITSTFWTLFAIQTMMHKDKEVIYLYINTLIRKQKLKKTLVYFYSLVKLIS